MDREQIYDGKDETEDITMATKNKQLSEPIHTPLLLGPGSSTVTCSHCGTYVKTRVRHSATARTHIAAAICFFICCCCCIPYCSDSARNADHYCPNCFKYLGTYEK